MASRQKSKNSTQNTDKSKEVQQREGTSSEKNEDKEESENLTLVLREIGDFRQDNKKLEDIKREIANSISGLGEAEARIVGTEEMLQSTLAEMLML